ncbi:hypothetical protein Tco_0071034 [Tanacetum coccineum]
MPTGKIRVYTRFFEFANFRLPLSTFLVDVLRYYRIHISQLSVIAAAKVSHFEIMCRVHDCEPTVGLFRCFYVNSKNKGWMSFSKRPGHDVVCYTKHLDSLKGWNDHFFWVDAFACPASFSWHTGKSVSKDHFPKSTKFNAEHYASLVSFIAINEMKENEVKAIKETEKWLNEAIPHEHKIEQSLNLQSKDVQINTVNALNVNSIIMEDKCNGKENSTLGRHLEEIYVTWAQFWKKPDKMTIWLKDGLKNQDQSVETASRKLVTLSKSHSDDVWKFVTPSESNSNDVWKFVTPSGSTVIKEALETLAWRRHLD